MAHIELSNEGIYWVEDKSDSKKSVKTLKQTKNNNTKQRHSNKRVR